MVSKTLYKPKYCIFEQYPIASQCDVQAKGLKDLLLR
ncbi:MAG: hypothetical protein ACI9ON_003757 [Limisphaerales bacterium]